MAYIFDTNIFVPIHHDTHFSGVNESIIVKLFPEKAFRRFILIVTILSVIMMLIQ